MKETTVSKFGAIISVACLLHCTILPLLIAAIPTLGVLAEHEWIEWLFWSMSACTGMWHVWKDKLKIVRIYFAGMVFLGTLGVICHNHILLYIGYVGIFIGMVYILLNRSRMHHTCTTEH